VPSTNVQPSLTIALRRAEIKAFWIVLVIFLSVALGLGSAALGARLPLIWAAAALIVLLPGLVWRQWFEMGVRGWNKGIRLAATAMRAYVMKVCYYLLFGLVSKTGSLSLDPVLGSPKASRWIPRARPLASPQDQGALAAGDESWGQGLFAFARTSPSKVWMITLLPVLLLLKVLRDEEQDSAPPLSTYTLY
jgi:hypothetical protein